MHERLSVNSLCFPDAGWPQLAENWRQVGTRRASFLSPLATGWGRQSWKRWVQGLAWTERGVSRCHSSKAASGTAASRSAQ